MDKDWKACGPPAEATERGLLRVGRAWSRDVVPEAIEYALDGGSLCGGVIVGPARANTAVSQDLAVGLHMLDIQRRGAGGKPMRTIVLACRGHDWTGDARFRERAAAMDGPRAAEAGDTVPSAQARHGPINVMHVPSGFEPEEWADVAAEALTYWKPNWADVQKPVADVIRATYAGDDTANARRAAGWPASEWSKAVCLGDVAATIQKGLADAGRRLSGHADGRERDRAAAEYNMWAAMNHAIPKRSTAMYLDANWELVGLAGPGLDAIEGLAVFDMSRAKLEVQRTYAFLLTAALRRQADRGTLPMETVVIIDRADMLPRGCERPVAEAVHGKTGDGGLHVVLVGPGMEDLPDGALGHGFLFAGRSARRDARVQEAAVAAMGITEDGAAERLADLPDGMYMCKAPNGVIYRRGRDGAARAMDGPCAVSIGLHWGG